MLVGVKSKAISRQLYSNDNDRDNLIIMISTRNPARLDHIEAIK